MTDPALAEIERMLERIVPDLRAGTAVLSDNSYLRNELARAILERDKKRDADRENGLRAQLAAEQHEHREACESYVKAASERNEAEWESERRRLLGLQYVEVIDSVRAQRDSLLAENAALKAELELLREVELVARTEVYYSDSPRTCDALAAVVAWRKARGE